MFMYSLQITSSDLLYTSCKSFYHHVCLFPELIISKSWTHIKDPPPSLPFFLHLISHLHFPLVS